MAVSPYALTIKRSAEKLFVWAIDLATGKPVADIPLTAAAYSYDNSVKAEPVALGRTDAEGILQATFAAPDSSSPLFLWSPAGARFAFGTTNWGEGIGPWDFGLPADYAHSPLIGNVYTDRPIYRPDQNVYIRGALRMAQGERYNAAGPGSASVSDHQRSRRQRGLLGHAGAERVRHLQHQLPAGAQRQCWAATAWGWELGVGSWESIHRLPTANP